MALAQQTDIRAQVRSRLAQRGITGAQAEQVMSKLDERLAKRQATAPSAQPDPYAKYQVQPDALSLGDGINNAARPNAFADPQIDPNNYGPEIEQAAKSITPQEIADLRAYAKASGGNLDGQQDSDVALVAARMKLQPGGVMQRRGPSVSPVQDGGVAATSPLGQMARAIPGVKQARDFAYGAAQGGISQPGSGISSVLGTASGLAGFDNAAALFHEAANQINTQAPQGTGAAFKLGTVAGQVAPAVSAAATGGATSPLVMGLLSTASFGSGVQEYRNALLSRGETPTPGGELTVGLGFAAVEYLTERIGLDSALRRVPGLSDSLRAFRTSPTPAVAAKLLDDLAPVMVANAGEEMAAQVGQNAIAKAKYDPNRDITAGTLEAGLLGAAGGSMIALPGAAVNALGAGLDAYDARRMMQAQQPASAPQSPAQAQAAPTDTTLDDAAALTEQRLNERYNPAPVGGTSADQVASSRPEQGNGDQATASVLRDLGITPEDFAQRVEEARVNQYRANPQQAYLDGKITREQLAAFLEERVAADPGEQLRRQAEARATGPQREMRRVDRPMAPTVTLDPNAQVPTAPEPRRFTDRLTVPQRAPEGQRQGANSQSPAADTSSASRPESTAATQPTSPTTQGSSPSPQSTREPWQMTRGEYASSANVLPQRKERLTDFFPEKGARGFIPGETDPDALFFERRNMRAAVDVGGRIFVGPTTHTSAMEAAGIDPMGPNFQKQYEDVIPGFVHEPTGTWFDQSSSEAHKKRVLRAHAANKPVPPEVLAEYGLNPPESPDGSNDSESPKGSTGRGVPSRLIGTRNRNTEEMRRARQRAENRKLRAFDRRQVEKENAARNNIDHGFSGKTAPAPITRKDAEGATTEDMEAIGQKVVESAFGKPYGQIAHDLLVNEGIRVEVVDYRPVDPTKDIYAEHETKVKQINIWLSSFRNTEQRDVLLRTLKSAGYSNVTTNANENGLVVQFVPTNDDVISQPQGQVAATTNKEPKNGEEVKAPQAQVLNAGTAAPAESSDPRGTGAASAKNDTPTEGDKAAETRRSIATLTQRARVHLQIFEGDVGAEFRKQLVAWSKGGPKPPRATGSNDGTPFTERQKLAVWRKASELANKTGAVHSVVDIVDDQDRVLGVAVVEAPKIDGENESFTNPQLATWHKIVGSAGHMYPGYEVERDENGLRIRPIARTAAPVSAGVVGAKTKPKPGDTAKAERQAEVDAIAPDSELDATGATSTIADIANNVREGKRRYVTARDSQNKRLGASMLASVRASVENGMARLREERKKWESRGRATIPQENADGTGTGSTGGVGAARVNGEGARTGQQAEDAGVSAKVQAAKRGNDPRFTRADIERRLFKLLEEVGLANTERMNDIASEESAKQSNEQFSTSFSDTTMKGEIDRLIEGRPFYRKFFRWNVQNGTGEESLQRLGEDRYLALLEETFSPIKTALSRASQLRGKGPDADMLLWLSERLNNKVLEGKKQPKKKRKLDLPTFDVMKASDLKDGQTFTIDGVNFEVMPDENDDLAAVERGANGEPIDNGQKWVLAGLDDIPTDAGTLGQADNTGEVPDIAPEQVTTEGDDADAMLGRIKEQLDRGSGRQSADMIRAFQELGSTLVPGVRLQDAEEVGRMYAMLDDGTVTLAEYTNYIDDLRNSGKVAKPEPVAPAPEQAPEKPKFSDSEGVFGQKTESITGSQTSMFGNIAPDVTPDATRYPGIRSGETVAEYEKRMGTTDTPDMFGGPSSTGGDPRSPNYRPDLNDRISDALGRWSAAARSRFDDYMGKMQRGEILGSGPPITPMLDLAAHIAFKALQSGITSKSGRKLTAFIEGRMADIRAKWPQLNVTADTLRRQVRNMLAAADDDKTKIIPAYAAARDRVERVRTKEAGKTLDNPRAVREAVASATAERPDVAAKIIDVVKKGIRQGKEAGILTATAQLQPLIDRAKRATQASRRAREMGKIEARGAVESVKAEAEARAEERRGIRAEAVRLVQDTPIAGRGKYLSAVANAKTMKDLSKVLGRLRRDLAKSVGNQFAKVAAQLKKQERTLNEDRRLEATKAWAAVAANLDTLKNHKATTEELEQAAQNIREAAEALRSIFHSQKNADKVSILGRAITAQEHRDEMVKRLEMRKQLPQSDTPGQPRDKAWLRQKFDKFLNFHSMMMALDQEFYGNGPFARAWRAMSERRTAELAKNQEFADRADKIARKYGYKGLAEFIAKSSGALGDASQQWIDVELGDFKRITLGQALDIYARDAETREKMHKRQRFTFDPEGGSGSFIINDAKIAQIENALTKQQKQLAREMNRLRSEMQFDRMNETYKTLTGNYLVQVPEHYPIRRAMKLSESPDITKGLGEWTIKKMEEAGYLKQRVGGSAPIVIGDFATTQLRQFQMAEAFIQRGTIVKYLGATLLHPDVRVPIVQRHGTKIMDRVQQTISEFSGNESPQQDRMLRKLMSNVARAQTQVNIGTWARNMATAFNVPLAIVDGKMIGVRKTLRGILKALASPRKTMQILMRHSPDLRHRWSHAGASISLMHGTDVQASTDIADTAFSDAAKGTIRQILSAIKGIGAGKFLSRTADVSRPWNQLLDAIKLGNVFDGFGAMVAYHAVRADAPASLSPNAADKWAARRAAGIFAQTANTNDLLNSNDWQLDARRSTWTAGILAFTSDIAKKQNLLYLTTKRGKKATAYATAAVTLGALWSTAITAAISAAVGDDEDKIKMRAAEGMAKELVSLIPGGTLGGNALEMWYNPRGSASLLDTPFTAITKNMQAAFNKFADAAEDGDDADVFEGAYRVLRVLNDLTGSPLGPSAGLVKRAVVNAGTE